MDPMPSSCILWRKYKAMDDLEARIEKLEQRAERFEMHF